MSEKVYLIDGSGYIFRAYYAVAPLTTRAGFPTNALFGYLRMIIKLIKQAETDNIAIVFDAGRDTFRMDLYPAYKANREECPADLKQQMPYFRDFARAMGLRVFERKGFEADDIIGTLSRRLETADTETVIVSGDKDLMQLVGEKVKIWDTMRDRWFGPAEVKEKLGVPPEQVIEFLGLTGDSSDNVPGIKGIGPKTAQQLLEKYGSIAQILASTAEIAEDKSIRGRAKIAEAIAKDGDLLKLCRELVTVKCDVPLVFDEDLGAVDLEEMSVEQLVSEFKKRPADSKALRELIAQFEFESLFRDFDLDQSDVREELKQFDYRTVGAGEFSDWLKLFSQQKAFALDLETTSLDVLQAEIVGLSFCWDDQVAWYLPVAHASGSIEQIDLPTLLESIKPILENADIKKCGQNLKYDASVLARYNVKLNGINFDSMIASYLLNPDQGSHNLTVLAREYLDRGVLEYEDVVGSQASFAFTDITEATSYASQDAHMAWLLKTKMEPRLKEEELEEVFHTIEMPLVPVLSEIERTGIVLDTELLSDMSKEFAEKLGRLEAQVYELSGGPFNLNSPKQLGEVLFGRLKIPSKGLKKTKTGISTDASVLEKLAGEHAVPALLLDYRALFKLKSTYVDALPAQISTVTGRLHTKLNQTVTATGRLSSSEPNLQNIPIQSEDGRRVRRAFIAGPGKVLISADYSQIEVRLLAHLSKDSNMCLAFERGVDIHASTARDLLGVKENEEVPGDLRRIGKTINFGVVYGMSGFRLARDLGLPVFEGNRYIEDYFNHYSGVRDYFNALEQDALSKGYVSTMFGRRRYLSKIESQDRDGGFLRRVAINAPIQGSAADLIKLAMINIDRLIKQEGLPVQMLLQIHDELLFEVEENFAQQACEFIRAQMQDVVKLRVPLKVEVGQGANWYLAH